MFNGLGMNLGNLSRISSAESHSICAENPTGGKGMSAMADADSNDAYNFQQHNSIYRWHIMGPIRFKKDTKTELQALGWRSKGRFYPGQHDICSIAYWYQALLERKYWEIV